MKKTIKLLAITIIIAMLMPNVMVNAATTKTEDIVESLKENVKSFDGTVNYENDTIEIEWNTPNSKFTEITYSYNGNVIEYDSGEITSYEEAVDVSNHAIYAIYLIKAALSINGYTDEQIQKFLSTENIEPTYEINGIEMIESDEVKKFISQDGYSTETIGPVKIKIDVTRANTNKSIDTPVTPKSTTIEDIIENLQNDKDFRTTEYEGKIVSEDDIYNDDETITITHTDYWDEYHNLLFNCENDIVTYKDDEIDSYDEAERAGSYHMFAIQILTLALQNNGYTNEQMQEFFSKADNEFDYELNGIELKEIGDSKTYTSQDGSMTMTVSPISIKIDLTKANLKKENEISSNEVLTYKFIEGANQTFKLEEGKHLTFKFDIPLDDFKTYGDIWIDEHRVEDENYTAESGSTIITFKDEFTKTLAEGSHHIEVPLAQGKLGVAKTDFTIEKATSVSNDKTDSVSTDKIVEKTTDTTQKSNTSNPKTGDDITIWISLMAISMLGIAGTIIFVKSK